jgi:hypothetical protein
MKRNFGGRIEGRRGEGAEDHDRFTTSAEADDNRKGDQSYLISTIAALPDAGAFRFFRLGPDSRTRKYYHNYG